MARLCVKCGKKIGGFSNDYFMIGSEHFLCSECGVEWRNGMNKLSKCNTKDEFETVKSETVGKFNDFYGTELSEIMKKHIEQSFMRYITVWKSEEMKKVEKNFLMTTGYDFSGYKINNYLGVISGQVVLGTGFLSEFNASIADFFGEESNNFADKLETAKDAAIKRLIKKAMDAGGNAIIGVDFDYITFHGNMIGVIANGTCVSVKKDNEEEY